MPRSPENRFVVRTPYDFILPVSFPSVGEKRWGGSGAGAAVIAGLGWDGNIMNHELLHTVRRRSMILD